MQECGVLTDRQTLNGAIIIAHHDKQFQVANKYWHPYFSDLARMFREEFPQCPCKLCAKSSNAEVSDGGPLTPESKQARTRRSLH